MRNTCLDSSNTFCVSKFSLSLAVDVLLLVHSHYSGSELLYSIDFEEGVDTLIPRQVMQVSNPTSAVEDLAIPDTNDVVLLRALW